MKSTSKNKMRVFLAAFLVLIVLAIGYMTYIWIDTSSVVKQLEQITKEPPNSRVLFKDDFWILVPKADDDGNIVSYVTKITRDYTWVWGDEGKMSVHIFITDDYPNSAPINYQADWIVDIKKIDGKWEIVDYKNIP